MGTPGISRKAVIHLVNRESGNCEAVVKAPLTEAARTAILREADVLATLADENYSCAPRLLYVEQERGIATQTALNGKVGSRRLAGSYWTLLRSLMLTGESTTIAGHAAEWQEHLLQNPSSGADITIMTAAFLELCHAAPLPAFWVHGDFAPWNIRHLPDGKVVLLDWENAKRSGLPLQDAFHFLHIQDYLFGARPQFTRARWSRLRGPSASRRNSAANSRLRTWLTRICSGWLRAKPSMLSICWKRSESRFSRRIRSRPVWSTSQATDRRSWHRSSRFSQSSRIRGELFAAVIAQLDSEEIPYCVLSGRERRAENCSSDVDFMFHSRDMHRIAPLLEQAARDAGGRLIQAMRHETSACHFVIAKDDGSETGYFDPDCTADYRKHGRLWLSAEKVLARRRRCRNLYVPAVADEFTYYLIKKVLKQSVADFQLRRLRHLYQRDPAACRVEILEFWSVATVRAVEKALMASDLCWFQSHLPELLAELKASAPVEVLGRRVVQKLQDGMRIVLRAVHPTGMSVLICDGDREQRSAIADVLVQQLSPAFRWTANVPLDPERAGALTSCFYFAVKILAARLRSTLVVSSAGAGKLLTRSLCPGPKWFASWFARLLFRPDLIFVLTADGQASAGAAHHLTAISAARKGRVIYLNSGLSQEQNSQQAVRVILRWLATRQTKLRSRAREHPAESIANPLTEVMPESVGLHLVVK